MSAHDHAHDHSHNDNGRAMRKLIWKTFWLLLVVTIFEVAIALTSLSKETLKFIFIGLTIVKAYYIVGIFMHVKHERLSFAWTLVLPFVLIVYFIYMMLYEGYALEYIDKTF